MATTQLNKTLGTPTNNYKWTISCWVKRATLGDQTIMSARVDGSNNARLYFNSSNQLSIVDYQSTNKMELVTSSVYRDVGAFYNIVVSSDNSLGSPVTKMYVNGVETTNGTSTQYSQNQANLWNSAIAHYIGQNGASASYYSGLMSYFAFVDGTAYDQSYFGETDSSSGIWKWKSPSVTYGTNGFFLKMDTSSPGTDTSGNSNTFTASGTPTLTQDNASNNLATLNPLSYQVASQMSAPPTNGNTTLVSGSGSAWGTLISTIGATTGKYYFEAKLITLGSNCIVGAVDINDNRSNGSAEWYIGQSSTGQGYQNNGAASNGGASYGATYTNGDIIGVAMDLDNNKIYWSKNGTFQNSGVPTSGSTGTGALNLTAGTTYAFALTGYASTTWYSNFGNGFFGVTPVASSNADAAGHGLFEYAVPTGYFTLNTKNLNTYG